MFLAFCILWRGTCARLALTTLSHECAQRDLPSLCPAGLLGTKQSTARPSAEVSQCWVATRLACEVQVSVPVVWVPVSVAAVTIHHQPGDTNNRNREPEALGRKVDRVSQAGVVPDPASP